MEKLSVILITGNEEKNIVDCLESIKWANEIIVVDSESNDKTVELANRYTDKIYINKWPGFAKQKSFALNLAANEWVLSIDADERVTDELKTEIETLDPRDCTGFFIKRENYFLGESISSCGWEKDYQLRLFKKDKTKLTDRLVHEGFVVEGKTGRLSSAMIHYTHNSITETVDKINSYSTLQAIELADRKKAGGWGIILHSLSAFLRYYFSQKGYKDGVRGLMVSLFNSMTTLLKYMKLWELQNKTNKMEK